MKQGKLVKTHNVIEAENCIRYLHQRPKMEMVGLGLLYGKPGLGKTTYASRMAFSKGYVYLRLESTSTPKNFALQLLDALCIRSGNPNRTFHGTANGLFRKCLILLEDHGDTVIVVDEIDYAFARPDLLGMLRDIVDETLSIVILVGMQNARERLLQINEYYFDRCNIFYEFTPVTRADIALLCKEVLEVNFAPDIVEYVHFHACGNLRKAMKIIHTIEQTAQTRGIECITLHHLEGSLQ
jgi:replication-associated recombination protein RarA